MKQYDILILGAGPGGYVAAIKAAQMGAKTALVEKKDIGGVCLNWGCIPTKTLLKSAHIYKDIIKAESFGIDIEDKSCVSINWPNMLKRKDRVVKQLTGGVKELLKKNGVDTYFGHGKVIDKNYLEVNKEKIKTKHLILATGSSAKIPSIDGIKDGLDRGQVVTSKEILSIKEIPEELVIIGGGVIGVEFATLFSTLGTKVTIVELASEILLNIDQEIRETMTSLLKRNGINIITEANVKAINELGVKIEHKGKSTDFNADKVLLSIGRTANTEDLGLLGLDEDQHGIMTNEKLETSVNNIYAIGDLNGKYMLAHAASAEGIVAVETIMGKESSIKYGQIPSCIYGFPEIGYVGQTEQRAKENGHEVLISTFPLSANGKALAEGESDGFIKIVADEKYGEVLGVHILAPNATDMIAEAVLAMELEGTVHELASSIHPHPTLSEIVMEAAHGAIDRPIHI